jgi:hypothetical protein
MIYLVWLQARGTAVSSGDRALIASSAMTPGGFTGFGLLAVLIILCILHRFMNFHAGWQWSDFDQVFADWAGLAFVERWPRFTVDGDPDLGA